MIDPLPEKIGGGPKPESMGRFLGQVVIVTGSAQGIGFAAARRIGLEGGHIVMVDKADEALRRASDALVEIGVKVKTIVADLSVYAEAERMAQEVAQDCGRIDVLVNNVGGTVWVRPFWEYDEAQIRKEVDQSFWPTLWCSRAVLPDMISRRAGAIVNIGSLSPRGIYRVPYAASKGGVIALTTSLALEVAQLGVRVNCVAPGPTIINDRATPRNPTAPDNLELNWRSELAAALLNETPMGRSGTVDEQAAAIAFLASADASYITGQILCVAGGASL